MTQQTFTLPTTTTYVLRRAGSRFGIEYPDADAAMAAAAAAVRSGSTATVEPTTKPQRIDFGDPLPVTDRDRIRDAFRSLRKTHVTSMGRICCSGCMGAELGPKAKDAGKGVVGFNNQHWQAFDEDRQNLTRTLYLQHGEPGDPDDTHVLSPAIVDALRAQGAAASWNGDPSSCIEVEPNHVPFCSREHDEDYSRRAWCSDCRAVRKMTDDYWQSIASAAFRSLTDLYVRTGDLPVLTDEQTAALVRTYGEDWQERVEPARENEREWLRKVGQAVAA